MRYNPCGRVVDYGRRAYVTKCRFWRDSDEEVDIVWYPAAPGAPVLGMPSKIQSLDLVSDPWLPNGVGEVYGAARTFNPQGSIPFLKYDHVCGTADDFARGGLRDAPGPDMVYTRDGLPVCCQPPFVGLGGAVGSGTADVVVTPGRVYCNQYTAELPFFGVHTMGTIIDDWQWFTLNYELQSPLYPGNTDWRAGVGFLTGFWTTTPGWDGHGARIFNNPLYPGVDLTITCVP